MFKQMNLNPIYLNYSCKTTKIQSTKRVCLLNWLSFLKEKVRLMSLLKLNTRKPTESESSHYVSEKLTLYLEFLEHNFSHKIH